MERSKKEEVVAALKRSFAEAQAVFVADFKGIDMENMTGLRVKVREAGGPHWPRPEVCPQYAPLLIRPSAA